MPLFTNSSSNNILPEVDPNEIPFEELPKPDGRRRLSLKMSIFNWSSQKQYIDKNKFLFDSCSVIPNKEKKTSHTSFILKSNKYATSHSHSSVNYDESDNEISSGSDLNENDETSSKDFYSMEDLENITVLKNKQKKVRKVAPLSESTLCYSSNTNTINTVSLEFNGKNKVVSTDMNGTIEGETINYGFEENPNIEESANNGYAENPNNEENTENRITNEKNVNEDFNNIDSSDDDTSDENDESNDELSDVNNYQYVRKPSKQVSNTSAVPKKTVTFCENIVIIEPKKHKNNKTKNIFKRAISKIIKKNKEESNNVVK